MDSGNASSGNITTSGNISSNHPRSGYMNDKYSSSLTLKTIKLKRNYYYRT